MTRQQVLRLLQQARAELLEDFGATSLAVFGSVARDQATPTSDVDVLVEFPGPPTFDQYMGLKLRLEDLLGVRVDLATVTSLRPRVRPSAEAEAIRVA